MQLVDPGGFTIYRSAERPWLFCTPDRLIMDGERIVAPVELKTAHYGAAKVWAKECPLNYMVQMQVQMYVLGCSHAYVAALLEGRSFRWHRVPRHQKFIDRLMKRLDHFWFNYVVKRVAPPTDYSAATTAALLRKYPTANGSVIELPDDCESLYEEMKQLTVAESAASKRKEEIKNRVRQLIGDARYGYLPSGKGFEWSGENGSRRFTLKERCPEPAGNH